MPNPALPLPACRICSSSQRTQLAITQNGPHTGREYYVCIGCPAPESGGRSWISWADLDLQKSVLRENHPDTIIATANLASTRQNQGRSNEAVEESRPDAIDTPSLAGLPSVKSTHKLNQINYVRATRVGDHISLPQPVVSGDQSAGKSSVLEGITGIPFPRQDGVCTKFTTEQPQLQVPGEEHPDTILATANLASTWHQQSRSSETEDLKLQGTRGPERQKTLHII